MFITSSTYHILQNDSSNSLWISPEMGTMPMNIKMYICNPGNTNRFLLTDSRSLPILFHLAL